MDYFVDSEIKITLMFVAYHGKESFSFTKNEILQIATMPAKKIFEVLNNLTSLYEDEIYPIINITEHDYIL